MESAPVQRPRLAWLDGLRAVAILLVIARHVLDRPFAHLYGGIVSLQAIGLPSAIGLVAVSIGWAGVHLFFLISGYLVAGGAIIAARQKRFYFCEFLAKRFMRVFVPAIIFLVGYRLCVSASAVNVFWAAFHTRQAISNFLFFNNYEGGAWLGHYWSLDVEAHFYIAVAIIAPLTRFWRNERQIGWMLISSGIIFVAIKVVAGCLGMPTQNFYSFSHWQFDFFAIGAGLRLISGSTVSSPVRAVIALPFAVTTLGIAATVAGYHRGILYNQSYQPTLTISLAIILVAVTALFLGASNGSAARFFGSNPLRALGRISFSVYIVQLPIIHGLTPLLDGTLAPLVHHPLRVYVVMFAIAAACSLAAGAAFYIAVEKPAFHLHSTIRIRWPARVARITAG